MRFKSRCHDKFWGKDTKGKGLAPELDPFQTLPLRLDHFHPTVYGHAQYVYATRRMAKRQENKYLHNRLMHAGQCSEQCLTRNALMYEPASGSSSCCNGVSAFGHQPLQRNREQAEAEQSEAMYMHRLQGISHRICHVHCDGTCEAGPSRDACPGLRTRHRVRSFVERGDDWETDSEEQSDEQKDNRGDDSQEGDEKEEEGKYGQDKGGNNDGSGEKEENNDVEGHGDEEEDDGEDKSRDENDADDEGEEDGEDETADNDIDDDYSDDDDNGNNGGSNGGSNDAGTLAAAIKQMNAHHAKEMQSKYAIYVARKAVVTLAKKDEYRQRVRGLRAGHVSAPTTVGNMLPPNAPLSPQDTAGVSSNGASSTQTSSKGMLARMCSRISTIPSELYYWAAGHVRTWKAGRMCDADWKRTKRNLDSDLEAEYRVILMELYDQRAKRRQQLPHEQNSEDVSTLNRTDGPKDHVVPVDNLFEPVDGIAQDERLRAAPAIPSIAVFRPPDPHTPPRALAPAPAQRLLADLSQYEDAVVRRSGGRRGPGADIGRREEVEERRRESHARERREYAQAELFEGMLARLPPLPSPPASHSTPHRHPHPQLPPPTPGSAARTETPVTQHSAVFSPASHTRPAPPTRIRSCSCSTAPNSPRRMGQFVNSATCKAPKPDEWTLP
ncbi:hypothetical protein QBC46DRAFT_412418 [Diplogelasinospora grovesii]|uniref:Uncharacterized protein n=1 Tax=Diplogelasinospora grovesii TaxID=303347 RepID=A0AAN6MZ00_9PEZI|nr:hypothetical protein QBC46DRAFT_412418 [Diplogelasinospora grovesii]